MRVVTTPSVSSATDRTSIDAVEARWAAEAVGSLARQLDADSIVGFVLQRAYRELRSLADSVDAPAEVVGPVRVRAA
jgi:hypothetical protein